jgi:hypothetical protein
MSDKGIRKRTGPKVWFYEQIIKRVLDTLFLKLNGYTTEVSVFLSLSIAAYWVFTGENPTAANDYLAAVFNVAVSYGHDPLLTAAQTTAIVGALDRAVKLLMEIISIFSSVWKTIQDNKREKAIRSSNIRNR